MNVINTILLQPTDVLFFRDGRPMEGSLTGHGAAWPLPNVTNAALHAALHRSSLNGHSHDQRRHAERSGKDNRRFGSLVTAGPFPVHQSPEKEPAWYFPRPLDLTDNTLSPKLAPTEIFKPIQSSLPKPLSFAVANVCPPSKDSLAKAWLHTDAYHRYIQAASPTIYEGEACDDSAFGDNEATVGIAIDPQTGTTGQGDAAGKIYSARYLRLRDDWRLGVLAKTDDKSSSDGQRIDLIPKLIGKHRQILVGGQQRQCTADLRPGDRLALPKGMLNGFHRPNQSPKDRWFVKWILLSPAIWPQIPAQSQDGRAMIPHCGGWLPNWVRESDGKVMLLSGNRQRRNYGGKHTRGYGSDSSEIKAKLVAAIVPKPVPVTGWALANDADREESGAKSTHLAVPAGAVYYFIADTEDSATALASSLNWNGSESNPTSILNRRSTLMGEKGFGLGVCGTWNFFGS